MGAPNTTRRPGGGVSAAVIAGKQIDAENSTTAAAEQADILRAHFNRAVELSEQKAELAADITEWRRQASGDGLVPTALLKLAREHLRDAEQQRKAHETAEVERLYRAGLGLPLFDWAAS